jgi:hypothetical protein
MTTTEKKTLHNNFILIHEFMHPNEPIKGWVRNDKDYTGNFHDQWDLLMDLVEKIEDIEGGKYDFSIYSDPTAAISDWKAQEDIIVVNDANTKIEAVYFACVEFIKWLNKQ